MISTAVPYFNPKGGTFSVTNRKTNASKTLTIGALCIKNREQLEEAVTFYNKAWNPRQEPWANQLFSITPEQFMRMHKNSPGGITAAFVGQKLAGLICTLNLAFRGKHNFPKTYNEIVTPDNYFGRNYFFANAKHCVAVLTLPEFQGFCTDHAFSIKGEEKQLSLGQVLVFSQLIVARRNHFIVHQFADSRFSSLSRYISEFKKDGKLSFSNAGQIFWEANEGGKKILRPADDGLYFEDGALFFSLKDYIKAEKSPGVPFDQMMNFHQKIVGGKFLWALPRGREKVVPDGTTIMDEYSLGYNAIYGFDPLADFPWFMKDIYPKQRQFVSDLAKLIKASSGPDKGTNAQNSLKKWILSSQGYRKTSILGECFSVDKTMAVLKRLSKEDLYEKVLSK